jgi:hypothetical protein
LIDRPTLCIGNGLAKTKDFTAPHQVSYLEGHYTSQVLLDMALAKLKAVQFEDLAYVGPNYLKEVYIIPSKIIHIIKILCIKYSLTLDCKKKIHNPQYVICHESIIIIPTIRQWRQTIKSGFNPIAKKLL